MGEEDPCDVCGGTESKLVDGFYYCVECGTQDTNVRETVVEGQLLADGTFAKSRRVKYKVKVKEGVQMSEEWYKWHKFNFLLAGLARQLEGLGAARSVRMKVLWMWTRYVRKYQKKDEMTRTKVLNLLEESSSSSDTDEAGAEAEGVQYTDKVWDRVWRGHADRYLLVALLALALVHDRSPIQVSQLTRWVTFRLLSVNDLRRFVPGVVLRRAPGAAEPLALHALTSCPSARARHRMLRAARVLRLGYGPMPDVEALVASQLRELRLPRALLRLVRALMQLARVDWRLSKGRSPAAFPAYEVTTLAYILVALKMCFGLDDDYELRLSDAVDGLNVDRPRAFDSDPEPTDRLFSFREWCAYIQHRKLVLARNYAPLAWARNMRTTDFALIEHSEEFTTAWAPRRNRASKVELSDQVTMDVLNKIPSNCETGVLPLEKMRPAAAAREPHVALARLIAPTLPPARRKLLDEDFTRYDLDYVLTRALPGHEFEGVSEAGKEFRAKLLMENIPPFEPADQTTVLVKDCGNKNWARTKRPTARHVVVGDCEESDSPAGEEERKLETFEEENGDIFDDDFFDIKIIKEEKPDTSGYPEAGASEYINESKDDVSWGGFDANIESTRRASVDAERDHGPPGEGRDHGPPSEGRDPGPGAASRVFDSDEESGGPEFDPATFNRAEIIKELMVTKYRKLSITPKEWHPRYKLDLPPKAVRRRIVVRNKDKPVEQRTFMDWKKAVADEKLAVGAIMSAYQSNLHREAMVQVDQQVRAFVDSLEDRTDDMEPLQYSHTDQGPEGESGTREAEEKDVEIVDGDSDGSIAGPAYDPVFKGDDDFNEKTYDVSQLYLKLEEAPPPAPVEDHLDDTVSALIDKLHPARLKQKPKPRPKKKDNIDHLVDNPDGISKFNYWVAHYRMSDYFDYEHVSELELEQNLPRSFRFVLLEGAGTLGAAPAALYARVCLVERALLALVPLKKKKKKKKANNSKNLTEDARSRKEIPKQATSKTVSQTPRKASANKKRNIAVLRNSDKAPSRNTPKAKIPKNTRAQKHVSGTSDDESDSMDSDSSCDSKRNSSNRKRKISSTSDRASDFEGSEASISRRTSKAKSSKKSCIQKDSCSSSDSEKSVGLLQEADNASTQMRRSGRLRQKDDEDPFWR